jgi:hypothetical protein
VNENRTSDDQEDDEDDDDEEDDEQTRKNAQQTGKNAIKQNQTGFVSNAFNTMNYLDLEKLFKSLGNDDKKIEMLKKKLSVYIRSKQRQTNLSFEESSTMADATETGT